jgi:outer membrane protein OmpU
MNILKKVSLTALGTSLIATSAFAGSMDVTGSAGITLANQDKLDKGNGLSMTDEITFTGSGELDNGMTVTVSMQLDDNAVSTATGTHYMDNRSVKIETGDMGTLTFYGHGGDSAFSRYDDTTPTAYGEAWDVLGTTGGGTAKLGRISGGASGNNMMVYSAPAMVDGLDLTVSLQPSEGGSANTAVQKESTIGWGVQYTGVEGLTLGYATDDNGATGSTAKDYSVMFAKYAYGPVTVGYTESEIDGAASTDDDEFSAMGVTYQVSDSLTIGYNESEYVDKTASTDDEQSTNISLSYTMGGMTLGAAFVTVDNQGGQTTAKNDTEGYEFDLSFAF